MTPEENKYLYELEEHHWWFRGMREILAALLDRQASQGAVRILDAGCGTGYMLSWLKKRYDTARVHGLDFSFDALQYCQERGERLLAQASVTALPFPSHVFDLVITLDVLDSFSPQNAARPFAELARILKRGGIILVRAPAFQFLYSQHDRAVSTAHRYTARELGSCLTAQGLVLKRITYANTLLFPVAAAWRLLRRSTTTPRSDVKPLPPGFRWLNPLLAGLLSLEANWLRHLPWRLPVGLSVIALARKSQ